mgnify:CR=1 FL=1
MAKRLLRGRVESGEGDATKWPTEEIRRLTRYNLVPVTLNVVLDAPHTLRPDFTLPKEHRSDERQEDLNFERCALMVGADRVRALIARTSTNYHGCWVLEIMAEKRLKESYGLNDGDWICVEVCVDPSS